MLDYRSKLANKLIRLPFAEALKVAARKAAFARQLKTGDVTDAQVSAAMQAFREEQVGQPLLEFGHFLQNTAFKLGPVALTTTLTTNIFNPGTTTGGVNCTSAPFAVLYVIFTHFRVINKSTVATVSLWKGATGANAAGTEFIWTAQSIAAAAAGVRNYDDWYGRDRFGQADFLVGGSNTATALTLTGEGEIGVGA